MQKSQSLLSEVEKVLKEKALLKHEHVQESKAKGNDRVEALLPSTAAEPADDRRVDSLVLPDDKRGRMPLTKDAYQIRENPHLVAWERELRKFLRNLSVEHSHRVSAAMVFEWATGMTIKDLIEEEQQEGRQKGYRTWRSDLRALNKLLKEYFGKPYMTYIAGHKVPKAYRVPAGYYIYRHRPKTLTLWVQWREGVKL